LLRDDTSSARPTPSPLLNLDDDELTRPEWGKANLDIDDPQFDVVLGCRVPPTPDEVRFIWAPALEGTLAKQALHERLDAQPDLLPETLVVGLEDGPLGVTVNARLKWGRA
jgi:hypothetical protein